MRRPAPILVADLFSGVHSALIEMLELLTPDEWDSPTVCPGWSVKDIALHLLGDDMVLLSRERDGFRPASASIEGWDDLVPFLNGLNERWVEATRRLSTRVICDLLSMAGQEIGAYVQTLDLFAIGPRVSWVSDKPLPTWMNIAREYTERWHHQQQIREAVRRPGMKETRYLAPVLDSFVRGLPRAFETVPAEDGTAVVLSVSGDSGGVWSLVRETGSWNLYVGRSPRSDAEVVIDEDDAWKLFTKTAARDRVVERTVLNGRRDLGSRVLDMVCVIA